VRSSCRNASSIWKRCMSSTTNYAHALPLCRIVLDPATIQTLLRTQSERLRNLATKLRDINVIEEGREAQIRRDYRSIFAKEILGCAAEAWVLVAEGRDEHGWFAGVVELVVDGSYGQYGALVLVQCCCDWGGQAALLDLGPRCWVSRCFGRSSRGGICTHK